MRGSLSLTHLFSHLCPLTLIHTLMLLSAGHGSFQLQLPWAGRRRKLWCCLSEEQRRETEKDGRDASEGVERNRRFYRDMSREREREKWVSGVEESRMFTVGQKRTVRGK